MQAIHGDELMPVSAAMPDDVIVLHDALARLREHRPGEPLTLYLKNCGTALRFLQVHLAECYPGEPITLDGDPRLKERDGKPTTQTTSALILHGVDISVEPDESPYITMSRKLMANGEWRKAKVEADWSSAAFWYEYVAIHGGELLLEGLTSDSLQGDRIVADIYAEHFGVRTTFIPEGAIIQPSTTNNQQSAAIDFTRCPDLYPAIALTCERLNIQLNATGTERLRYKESDRIEAAQRHEMRNDHRIAMALLAADYLPLPSSPQERDQLQTVIAKSYPQFLDTLEIVSCQSRQKHGKNTAKARQKHGNELRPLLDHIVPIKGVNDDNLGKKHALSKLIHASTADYVWLHDDDVVWPSVTSCIDRTFPDSDIFILPLRMEIQNAEPSLLEKLQIAEYAAIQELTMKTAKHGRAVMCSGANLIVRREAWLACEPDLHPEIPSGDDMFLLEAAKRRGMRIAVIDEPAYTAIVRPQTTWRAFFRQRMRWAGKAPAYTDKDIRRCGFIVAASNVLQLLCPLIILIKFPVEYSLIRKREPQTLWLVALLLEVLYPFYLLVSLVGGMLRRSEW
ncbi:MAG: glycosyltransferase [Paludibacteraceae bacterium]|nr:glycosyltransferase [Paludibacteraceae bacterium]